MKKSKHTLENLLDLAMEMEQQAYDFYAWLEKHFQKNDGFVECLCGIKEDERLHLRVLKEIKASLSDVRLQSPVDPEAVEKVQGILKYVQDLDPSTLRDSESIITAIQTLEAVEFDMVMQFVDMNEIHYEFTREYLRNESVDHTNRIYRAQHCLD